jgi:hypothetical protein
MSCEKKDLSALEMTAEVMEKRVVFRDDYSCHFDQREKSLRQENRLLPGRNASSVEATRLFIGRETLPKPNF